MRGLEFIDLRRITGVEMDPLLLEETVEWSRSLDWDFGQSAEAIRGCIDERGLRGCAVLDGGEVVGYGYTAVEDRKGMVGDVYVRSNCRNAGYPNGQGGARLFRMLLDGLLATPGLERLESQMMLMDRAMSREAAAGLGLSSFDRMMMTADLSGGVPEPPLDRRRYRLDSWRERHFEGAAGVITVAYEGHIDSLINDQYRSMTGARKFLRNILRFPSVGLFSGEGSVVAVDVETGRLCGLAMVSVVGPVTGHISQLCVVPGARGSGVGRALIHSAMNRLAAHGMQRVTLAVTDANAGAVELYRQCGFVMKREFSALAAG